MVQQKWTEAEHDGDLRETRPGKRGCPKVSSCGRCSNAGLNPRAEKTVHAGFNTAKRYGPSL